MATNSQLQRRSDRLRGENRRLRSRLRKDALIMGESASEIQQVRMPQRKEYTESLEQMDRLSRKLLQQSNQVTTALAKVTKD